MSSKILDWFPEEDKYSKTSEIEIHNLLHEKKANEKRTIEQIWGGKRKVRSDALEKILSKLQVEISGNVLEVGAGDGWCSAYITKNKPISSIYVMECNKPAVERLIPRTFEYLGVRTDKVKFVYGSFNYINENNFFDSVVAMGALHHAANLRRTFSEIYKALKPGGFLVAQEPYMQDDTPNSYYFEREDREINFWGVKNLKNSDRTDLFYRECEYKTAAYHSGFDFSCIKLDEEIPKYSFIKKIMGKKSESSVIGPKNMIFILRKPYDSPDRKSPTAWE